MISAGCVLTLDLSTALEKSYDPTLVEVGWDMWWEACGFYSPSANVAAETPDNNKFVMVIPPPNVTGSLHLGHSLTCAIEDALARWQVR